MGTAVVGAAVLHHAQPCPPPRTEDCSPHSSAQLVGRRSLVLQGSVLWKALGHPGCVFTFQRVTAFFLSSDRSILSSSVGGVKEPTI